MRRVSVLSPVSSSSATRARPRRARPPVAWRTSVRRSDGHRSSLAPARSSNGSLRVADDLVVLVSLPGEEDDVAGTRQLEGALDRTPAIELDLDHGTGRGRTAAAGAPVGMPATTSRTIAAGSSLRGIVARDEHQVGERRGDAPHPRPLACVAIAAAAEDADQCGRARSAAAAAAPSRARRGVRVVDDDERRVVAAHRCVRPGGARPRRAACERVGKRRIAREQHRYARRSLRRVDAPNKASSGLATSTRPVTTTRQPVTAWRCPSPNIGVREPVRYKTPCAARSRPWRGSPQTRHRHLETCAWSPGLAKSCALAAPYHSHRAVDSGVGLVAHQVRERPAQVKHDAG